MMLILRSILVGSAVLLVSGSVVAAGGEAGDFSLGVTTVVPGPKFTYWYWYSQETATAEPAFPAFTFRYWNSETFTIEPSLGLIYIAHNHRDDEARLVPGLGFAYHFRPNTSMRPYVAFRLGIDWTVNSEARIDLTFGPAFGAEYFFSDWFSIDGEYRLTFVRTDEDRSPSPLANDATYIISFQLLSLHFYL